MDLISIQASASNFSLERYAHSYIGFGITPEIGDELNQHRKDIMSEIVLVTKVFAQFEPFTITIDGDRKSDVEGKSGSGRVDFVGGRLIKKQKITVYKKRD